MARPQSIPSRRGDRAYGARVTTSRFVQKQTVQTSYVDLLRGRNSVQTLKGLLRHNPAPQNPAPATSFSHRGARSAVIEIDRGVSHIDLLCDRDPTSTLNGLIFGHI
jgi:hypothetical protein